MKKKKIIAIILLSILILIGLSFIFANYYLNILFSKMETSEVIEDLEINSFAHEQEQKELNEVVNIALFGVDSSSSDVGGEDNRSDAIKIVSLDYTNKEIKITSIERDVVAYFPGDYQDYGHYNWAYWFGGPKLAIQTLNYNLDLDIEKYVKINFSALVEIIDYLNGVSIDMTGREASIVGVGTVNGHYTLNGHQALSYARIRKLDSDFQRMERQNMVIQSVINDLSSCSVNELLSIVNKLAPYISTNLNSSEIKNYLVDLLLDGFKLNSIKQYKMPSGEYNDICNCPGLGGYLLRSYSFAVKELHENIYEDYDYIPSNTVMENEARTYEKFGQFSKE